MATGKTRIVIIDDEEDLCFLLSNLLVPQGFEVHSFYTLSTGLEGISKIQPQWVIMDNDLPDGYGWERVNNIVNAIPGVKVIMISANPDSRRDFKMSNISYLIKPIEANSILALIGGQKNSV